MQVMEVHGEVALVEQAGVAREVRVDFLEGVEPGDYVLVHAGLAIERLRPEEAEETLRLIRELADAVP
jgi:hydrogenase expression/formation protein HypC